ncbi:MAG TPA: hypothetical protein VEC99_02175, partial [Clostridia bacterium]|nr:hypothetical protein [Clostridia bacterium]
MKRRLKHSMSAVVLLAALNLATAGFAQTIQLISTVPPNASLPAGGDGDSWGPVISRNGQYVLFASMAHNLVLTTNGTPLPFTFPGSLNVYLCDRTNGTTSLVSVDTTGTTGGDGDSFPVSISTDGRYAV